MGVKAPNRGLPMAPGALCKAQEQWASYLTKDMAQPVRTPPSKWLSWPGFVRSARFTRSPQGILRPGSGAEATKF